jgi:hypothetical protein
MLHTIYHPLRFGIGLTLLTLVGLLVARCGGAQQGSQEEGGNAPPVAGSFVEEVSDPEASVRS